MNCTSSVYNASASKAKVSFEVTPMKMKDAVILVTGASRGLGRSLVRAATEAGAKRVYATARNPKQVDASDIVVPLALDVTDPRSIAEAAARAGDISMLINNAGLLASANVLTSSPEKIAEDFATNFFGPLAVTKAFLPALEKAKEAAVVNVLSVASLANVPLFGAYSTSKAAAHSLTQALRVELAKKRIAVHGVFAGTIDTDMVRGHDMPKTSPDVVAKGIIDGVEQGLEDIAPDPASRELVATWLRDPKAVERMLASTT